MRKLLFLSVLLVFVSSLFAECEFMGLISKAGRSVTWENMNGGLSSSALNDPMDFFKFLEANANGTSGNENTDAWGVLAYTNKRTYSSMWGHSWNLEMSELSYKDITGTAPADQVPLQYADANAEAWYCVNQYNNPLYFPKIDDPNNGQFEAAYNALFNIGNKDAERSVILGHVRQGTGGKGAHPFTFKHMGKTYSLMHNGNLDDLKGTMFYGANLANTSPQWSNDATSNQSTWIDSEVMFRYILKKAGLDTTNPAACEKNTINLLRGIYLALNDNTSIRNGILSNYSSTNKSRVNFVLSDGEHIYAYVSHTSSDHKIYYKDFENYFGIVTDERTGFTEIPANQLVVFSRHGLTKFDNFVSNNYATAYEFLPDTSGNIRNGNFANPNVYISADAGINVYSPDTNQPFQLIDKAIRFAGTHDLTVNKTTELKGLLELDHGSQLKATGATFTVKPGSWVKGAIASKPHYYYTSWTFPGGLTDTGERYRIHGDRIYVANNGNFTGVSSSQYSSTLEETRFMHHYNEGYCDSDIWDGIVYNYLTVDKMKMKSAWFTKCSFKDMENFVVNPKPLGLISYNKPNPSFALRLYASNVENVEEFKVRDKDQIHMGGEGSAYSNITKAPNYAIVAEDGASLHFDRVKLGTSTTDRNDEGIYIKNSNGYYSNFTNTRIRYCLGTGFRLDNALIKKFYSTWVQDNSGTAIYCTSGTRFVDPSSTEKTFNYVYLVNNTGTDFVGLSSANFKMDNNNRVAYIANNFNNGKIKLINLGWTSGDAEVNIKGVPHIQQADINEVSPANDSAWLFNNERAADQQDNFGNGNFARAEAEAYMMLENEADNPATKAHLFNLFHMAAANNEFASLKNTLNAINNENLYFTAQNVLVKIAMAEGDYSTAINKTEELLSTTKGYLRNEILADQGHAYLQLNNATKANVSCTFMPKNANDYHNQLKDFENGVIAEFEEINNTRNETPEFKALTASNYPNPFNPVTKIDYTVPADGKVTIDIYNVKGQKVKTLVNGFKMAGKHNIEWQGKDANNQSVASGVYFYKIKTTNKTLTKKMLLLK